MSEIRNYIILSNKKRYKDSSPYSLAKKYTKKYGNTQEFISFQIKETTKGSKNKLYNYQGKLKISKNGKFSSLVNSIKTGGNSDEINKFKSYLSQMSQGTLGSNLFEGQHTRNSNTLTPHAFFVGWDVKYNKVIGNPNYDIYKAEKDKEMLKSDFVEKYKFLPVTNSKEKAMRSFPLCYKNSVNKPCKKSIKGFHQETFSFISRHLQQSYNVLNRFYASTLGNSANSKLKNESFFGIGSIDKFGNVKLETIEDFYYFIFVKFSKNLLSTYIEIPYIVRIKKDFLDSLYVLAQNYNKRIFNVKEEYLKTNPIENIQNLLFSFNENLNYEDYLKKLVNSGVIAEIFKLKKMYGKKGLRDPISQMLYEFFQGLPNEIQLRSGPSHISYNINVNNNSIKLERSGYARGTIYLKQPPNFFRNNPNQFLNNCIEAVFPSHHPITSFRYGTPYAMGNADEFYTTQCRLIQEYIGNKKAIIISLLDIFNSNMDLLIGDKRIETQIIRKELEQYGQNMNIVYMNMSINSNINTSTFYTTFSESSQEFRILESKLDTLSNWIHKDGYMNNHGKKINNILKILKDNIYPYFKENILFNRIPNHFQNILKYITVTSVNGRVLEVRNEICRLMMFCYLSLIFYFMSIRDNNEYVLLYHCKSGQDRTGTFYAVNQMVNEITKEKQNDMINFIQNWTTNKRNNASLLVELYNKFFNALSPNESEKSENRLIRKRVYDAYAKYLTYSYFVTYTSTGFPGLKWNLGNIKFGLIDVENRFPYLLLKTAEDAELYEGASSCRSS